MVNAYTGTDGDVARQLAHVRWIAGGTGTGKSTVTAILAARHDVEVYDGDRREHGWLPRCTRLEHPRLAALRDLPTGGMWPDHSGAEIFAAMPGLHGETIGLMVEDLLAMPRNRIILVDYFGNLPRFLAPLVVRRDQAAFLVPTPAFRRTALTARYADPARARANWGDHDPVPILAKRLERDALWDSQVRRQAGECGFDVITVDGTRSAAAVADEVEAGFDL